MNYIIIIIIKHAIEQSEKLSDLKELLMNRGSLTKINVYLDTN